MNQREVRKDRRINRETNIDLGGGDAGAFVIGRCPSNNKAQYFNRLSLTCRQWETAVHFINRAIYNRRLTRCVIHTWLREGGVQKFIVSYAKPL
jgi:hypothetical protein